MPELGTRTRVGDPDVPRSAGGGSWPPRIYDARLTGTHVLVGAVTAAGDSTLPTGPANLNY